MKKHEVYLPGPKPVVEVMGPWLHNKGDVLMIRSICDRLGGTHVLAAGSRYGMRRLPRGLGLQQARWRPRRGELSAAMRSLDPRQGLSALRRGALFNLCTPSMLRRLGILEGSEITGLLDCSGYAYGDVWGIHRMKARAEHYAELKRRGARIVLLPQALGPFEKPEVRAAAEVFFRQFDRIFARDPDSMAHLRELGISREIIHEVPVPDITHLLEGKPPADPSRWRKRVCVVPNARMGDKTDAATAGRNLGFLLDCIRAIRRCGHEPCLVIHERNDAELARAVRERDGGNLPVVDEDAVATKGMIGASRGIVCSRYHALISALSQGVPALGTSWSHKYEALFDAYGASDCLVPPTLDPETIDRRMRRFLDEDEQVKMRRTIAAAAARQKAEVRDMWETVEGILDNRRPMRGRRETVAAI